MSDWTPPAEAVEAGAQVAADMNVDGWIVVPHPNTGDPVQERVPTNYIVSGILTAAYPAIVADLQGIAAARLEALTAVEALTSDPWVVEQPWVLKADIRAALPDHVKFAKDD